LKLSLYSSPKKYSDDGIISKPDLIEYLRRTTGSSTLLSDSDMTEMVNEVFKECASDPKQECITLSDYQQIVARLDFQSRLLLPI